MPRQYTGQSMRAPGSGRKSVFVPPGGFAGFAQQTPATQALLGIAGVARAPTSGRRRKKKKRTARKRAAPASPRRSTRRKKSGAARLVKGSAAAKRHMARLRKMRKK
jgi:hypothetical protein